MSVLSSIIDRSISGNFSSDLFFNVRSHAFYNCTSLTNVAFPNAIGIGNYAFYSCTGLTSASFPNATSIGSNAFDSCSGLTTIYVGTNTSTVCTLSNTNAFNGCTNLTNILVPANLVDEYKSATNWSNYADKIYPNQHTGGGN